MHQWTNDPPLGFIMCTDGQKVLIYAWNGAKYQWEQERKESFSEKIKKNPGRVLTFIGFHGRYMCICDDEKKKNSNSVRYCKQARFRFIQYRFSVKFWHVLYMHLTFHIKLTKQQIITLLLKTNMYKTQLAFIDPPSCLPLFIVYPVYCSSDKISQPSRIVTYWMHIQYK